MTLDRDRFAEFFTAVRPGQHPFAWQLRLLDALLEDGRWPDRIVAPTGAGKTAVIDVHVYANAMAATGLAPRLPRRLVLVVDRRVVVDSHDDHARTLANLLTQPSSPILTEVSDALASLRVTLSLTGMDTALDTTAEPPPLVTARLRGGSPPPRGWRDSPEVCAVLTGTPDMIGSRLLLQGYGSSSRAWSREAGLLAFDTALVVDEAHLTRQFLATARRVADLARPTSDSPVTGQVPVLQVIETTATPQPGSGVQVGVEPTDLVDPILEQRMSTAKPVELLAVADWPLTPKGKALQLLVAEVLRARADFGPTVGCVVNRVASATALARSLRAAGLTVELLVGRMRPADVAHLRRRRPGLLDTTGNSDVDVLVATQTIEVGLDLDLSALVTELAPGAALAQRSGRVNRRGLRPTTRVVVAVPETGAVPEKGSAPYTVDDLQTGLAWISARADTPEGLAPWAVRLDPPPGQALRRTVLQRVELADSWVWARTGDEPFARPDLDLWLSDDLDADRDVGLISRANLPTDPVAALTLLRLLPPRAHEVFPVTLPAMRNLLEQLLNPVLPVTEDNPELPGPVLRRRADITTILTPDDAGDLRVGDVFIVDASYKVQQEGVVGGDGDLASAPDVLEHGGGTNSGVRPGSVALRWGAVGLFGVWTNPLPALLRTGPTGNGGAWTRAQRAELADLLAHVTPPAALPTGQREDLLVMQAATVQLLRTGRVKDSDLHLHLDLDEDQEMGRSWLVVLDLRRAGADEDVRQTWTPSEHPVPLEQHARNVAATAAQIALDLGLDKREVETLRLAGYHHDDGKADPRFQVILGRTDPADPPLAKSARRSASGDLAARSQAGLPSGWRHEQLSALSAWRTVPLPLQTLVTRLVGTSHGHGRSAFPHGAGSLLGMTVEQLPGDAMALFQEGTWEQLMDSTDEQHGVWSLAYLEALLRAADGRVSAAGS